MHRDDIATLMIEIAQDIEQSRDTDAFVKEYTDLLNSPLGLVYDELMQRRVVTQRLVDMINQQPQAVLIDRLRHIDATYDSLTAMKIKDDTLKEYVSGLFKSIDDYNNSVKDPRMKVLNLLYHIQQLQK